MANVKLRRNILEICGCKLNSACVGVVRADAGGTTGLTGYRIPFKNSSKFPKGMRPPHLQDDDIFDSLSIEAVTTQLAIWTQTKAT